MHKAYASHTKLVVLTHDRCGPSGHASVGNLVGGRTAEDLHAPRKQQFKMSKRTGKRTGDAKTLRFQIREML